MAVSQRAIRDMCLKSGFLLRSYVLIIITHLPEPLPAVRGIGNAKGIAIGYEGD